MKINEEFEVYHTQNVARLLYRNMRHENPKTMGIENGFFGLYTSTSTKATPQARYRPTALNSRRRKAGSNYNILTITGKDINHQEKRDQTSNEGKVRVTRSPFGLPVFRQIERKANRRV